MCHAELVSASEDIIIVSMLKKLFNWRVMLGILVVIGFLMYKPEVIPDETWRSRVTDLRDQLLQQKPPDTAQVGQILNTSKEKVLGLYDKIQEDQKIPGLPEEVVVDEYVSKLTAEVKQIPNEQLKAVKRQFCQDVIDEATGAAIKSN